MGQAVSGMARGSAVLVAGHDFSWCATLEFPSKRERYKVILSEQRVEKNHCLRHLWGSEADWSLRVSDQTQEELGRNGEEEMSMCLEPGSRGGKSTPSGDVY